MRSDISGIARLHVTDRHPHRKNKNIKPQMRCLLAAAAICESLESRLFLSGTALSANFVGPIQYVAAATPGNSGTIQPLVGSAPTDNPIATFYGANAYPWTNNINWSNVVNINAYMSTGVTMVDHFNAAQNALVASGGGVLYFPAGTYNFEDSIQIQNGVVLRGDNPTNITDAKTPGFAPPTQFVFPKYNFVASGSGTDNSTAFKTITSANPQTDSNQGLVNIDVNRAAIAFDDGGNITARNTDIVVFGVRSNNVANPWSAVPTLTWSPTSGSTQPFQNAWQRFSNPFAANITVNPWRNALVANDRLNDATTDNFFEPGYVVTKRSGGTNALYTFNGTSYSDPNGFVEFSYTDHYGIMSGRPNAQQYGSTPVDSPAIYRPGIVIRDNDVLTTMRVKLYIGGYGTQILNNVTRDVQNKVVWADPLGTKWQTNNSATYENRAVDLVGWNNTVSGNNLTAYQARITNTPYSTVDGEGILMQNWYGSLANEETITNNVLNGPNNYIGLWQTKEIRNCLIQGNTLNGGSIYSNSIEWPSGHWPTTGLQILNNNLVGHAINVTSDRYSDVANNVISGNTNVGSWSYTSPGLNIHDNTGAALPAPSGSASLVEAGPTVSITSPTFLQTTTGPNVTITAAAACADGSISRVDFYDQSTLIGTGTSNGNGTWSISYNGLAVNEYMVEAVAYNNAGTSWTSDPIYFSVQAPTAPAAPSGAAASGINANDINVSWNSVSGATGYNIFRGTSAGGESGTPLNASPVTTTSYNDLTVNSATTYYYTVQAVNAVGSSSSSNEASATTVPAAPIISASAVSSSQVNVTWNAVTGATGYNIYRGTSVGGESATPLNSSPVTGASYNDLSVGPNVTYYYVVKAIDAGGLSAASNEASAVTPYALPSWAGGGVSWNPVTNTLTVFGAGWIQGDPGALNPNVVILTTGSLAMLSDAAHTQSTFHLGNITIQGNGKLDIGENKIIETYSGADPFSSIAAAIALGHTSGGTTGIMSSNTTASQGVGFADGNDGIDPSISSGQIAIQYAIYGDMRLQGSVDFGSYQLLLGNYGQTVTKGWEAGDFFDHGSVDFGNYQLLLGNYGKSLLL